jgi:crotonobetainyl-CoA:carnitine CoA-transferase CaiB-like acyl-CoA transferase
VYGTLRQVGALWDFGDLPLSLTKPPPSLGEHSREVLDMLGFGAAEIDTLVAGGVSRMG